MKKQKFNHDFNLKKLINRKIFFYLVLFTIYILYL